MRKITVLKQLLHDKYDRYASLGAAVAVTFVVIRALLVDDPERFAPGARITSVVFALSLNYLAGYIFYIIVVAGPKIITRQHLRPALNNSVASIIGNEAAIFQELGHKTKDSALEQNNPKIAALCAAADPKDGPTRAFIENNKVLTRKITRWEAIRERVLRTQQSIERIQRLMPFLDGELVKILDEIETCSIVVQVRDQFVIFASFTNKDMSSWASEFEKYNEIVNRLRIYLARELKED